MQVKIINQSNNELPKYETLGSAGMDLRAFLTAPISLQPLERILITTGLFIELPNGYEGQVRPRSGLAIKKGITVINSPGTIDSDYRGEIKIPIINLSAEVQVIENGDRIAQLVVAAYTTINWDVVVSISDSSRGTNGFGSSGIK
jgi:dUTP pyrophosphatase